MHRIRSAGEFYFDRDLAALIRETQAFISRAGHSHRSRSRGLDLSTSLFHETTNVRAPCGNSRSVATRSQASAPRTGVAILIDPLRPFGAILSSRSAFLLARHVEHRAGSRQSWRHRILSTPDRKRAIFT